MPNLSACRRCERATRPRRTVLADYPGTVALAGRGLCKTCYERVRHQRVRLTGRGAPRSTEHNVLALSDYVASRNARISAHESRQARRASIRWAA